MAVGFGEALGFGLAEGFGEALGFGVAVGVGLALGVGAGEIFGSGKTIGGSTLKRSTVILAPGAFPLGILDKKNGPTTTAFGSVPRNFS